MAGSPLGLLLYTCGTGAGGVPAALGRMWCMVSLKACASLFSMPLPSPELSEPSSSGGSTHTCSRQCESISIKETAHCTHKD